MKRYSEILIVTVALFAVQCVCAAQITGQTQDSPPPDTACSEQPGQAYTLTENEQPPLHDPVKSQGKLASSMLSDFECLDGWSVVPGNPEERSDITATEAFSLIDYITTPDEPEKGLKSSSSIKTDGGNKKASASTIGMDSDFHLSADYAEKLPSWRKQNSLQRDAEFGAGIELPLLFGMKGTGKFSGGKYTTHADQDFHGPDSHSFFARDKDQFSDSSNQSFQLDIKGQQDNFDYGMKYYSQGDDYESLDKKKKKKGLKNDRAGYDYWLSWKHNRFTLGANMSDSWGNLNSDPDKTRMNDSLFGITSSYTINKWPYVGISTSYKTGTRESSMEASGKKPYEGPLEKVSTTLNMSTSTSNVYISSALSKSSNELLASDNTNTVVSHSLGASYYPVKSVYITPAFSLSQTTNDNAWQNYEYTSSNSSLSVLYKPSKSPFTANAYVSYDKYESNDGYTDADSIFGRLSLGWTFKDGESGQHALTFELENNVYLDHVYSNATNSDIFAGVFWRWTGR